MNETSEVKIRRAPKLSVFLVIGGLLGGLVTLIAASQFPADPHIGFAATLGYFLLFGIPAGVVLGALVGLIIDRVSIARARTVVVEHEVVAPEAAAGAPDAVAPAPKRAAPRKKRAAPAKPPGAKPPGAKS